MNRRHLMHAAFAGALASDLAVQAAAAAAPAPVHRLRPAVIRTSDGANLAYTDWGSGQAVVFVHAWAMHSHMWAQQVAALTPEGFRCITFDRRGHGRSPDPGRGYDIDQLADDLAAVLGQLDLKDVTLVAHSMGGAEAVRCLARHGSGRVKQLVLLAPATPCLTRKPDNPLGVPAEAFEQLRGLWARDFPKWVADNAPAYLTPQTSPETLAYNVRLMLECPITVAIAANKALVAADLRADCKKIDVPTLIVHGDKDASAPLELTGRQAAALIPGARLEVLKGAPHGLYTTHVDAVNAAILGVLRS